jgi:hypothetical protein
MRRSAEIARNLGVPLELTPAEGLALLDEVERLRADLAKERKTRAELGRLIGALGRAGGVPT